MNRVRETVDLNAIRWAIQKGKPVVIPDIDVAVCQIDGHTFRFASDRIADPIQRSNRGGAFYEEPELAMIKAHFPQGGTFVDIGSNIGNHSLFVAAFLQPKKIIPFEPNPLAYKLLLANVVLNEFSGVFDLRHIGFGVSDEKADGFGMTKRKRNLGAARMQAGEGDIETITGDEAMADDTPDFIKIDVEGMEMLALRGLQETITRCAPMILIEVDQENYAAFDDWVEKHGYDVIDTFKRYTTNKNFLLRKQQQG
ncbi:FkbM family methyltransferase [Sulfitobacter sp. SK011]|uniref:FkbM family methyltransferase n=1 Tax=Sulfitobacter sp. SK011 TaxID=1389004 RepID=UPI000E0C7D12|nr:FkbM family methyltransferase [Sulfitobacter sp. SK011]AXI42432.1 FkbM family methyltransferase [Sulfitobacter sp. SK011]